MKKTFILCCSTDHGNYLFSASWDEKLNVEYEFEDVIFAFPFKNKKGILDLNTSKLFIEYINKASIYTIEENIKKKILDSKVKGYCIDRPKYKVMYMDGNWFDTASWDFGGLGASIEQQKYLYLAMMLCDENAINFIYWDYEGKIIDIPFEGEVRDFYFFNDNNEIISILNNKSEAKLSFDEELKERFSNCFKTNYKIPYDSANDDYWNLILINDKDEVFYYTGCKNDNPCMDEIVEFINSRHENHNESSDIEIIKRTIEYFKKNKNKQ